MSLLNAKFLRTIVVSALFSSFANPSIAAEEAKPAPKAAKSRAAAVPAVESTEGSTAQNGEISKPKKIRYKAGKQVDFDRQTIQGELRRPEISVVTGNEKTTDNGLLRLREDFVDRITAQAGEEVE